MTVPWFAWIAGWVVGAIVVFVGLASLYRGRVYPGRLAIVAVLWPVSVPLMIVQAWRDGQ